MGLAAALDTVLATFRTLTIAGAPLRAFADSGKVDPPCVWVPTPSVEFQFSKKVIEVAWQAYLVAPNQNLASISPTLSELVDAVTGLYPFTSGEPQLLTLPGGGQPVPTYQLTWNARVPIGD